MEIPVGVEVICGSEVCGHSMYLLINPVNDQVTHLVVAEKSFPHTEHLVPIEWISESTATATRLHCSPDELAGLEMFMQSDYLKPDELEGPSTYDESVLLWPYCSYLNSQEELYEHIPAGEVAIRRGSRVKATDGNIGTVDEFLINPLTDRISHIVMRKGHLWGAKDVSIPVSEIEKIDDDIVYLKLDRKTVAALHGRPIHRKWK